MSRRQIVLLGMMTKIPVAGVVWQTLHYLVGLERLGFETYYVEAHARTPSMLMKHADDDGSQRAASFIANTLGRFGFGDRWAFQALHADGRCYGLSQERLDRLFGSAELIINLHGGTEPRTEHFATNRLVYLETDPVEVEIQLAQDRQETIDYLRPHLAFFTFGENYGRPGCALPVTELFDFRPTRQPVVIDFWHGRGFAAGDHYTTVGNWRQQWREITFGGETYGWSKDVEFLKFLDVPSRTRRRFELALSSFQEADRRLLEQHGWRVVDGLRLSEDIDVYRGYIAGSRGEFTVAKDQNVRLRTGWFSDRAATYLAAGRPVVTQDTGFGISLPTGEGLFAFSTQDDIVAALDAIESDYPRHSRAAADIAREYFDASRVLGRLLSDAGVPPSLPATRPAILQPDLDLNPVSRRPLVLNAATIDAVVQGKEPARVACPAHAEVSIVVVTQDTFVLTKLMLASLLVNTESPAYQLIVVDNHSQDGTAEYLTSLNCLVAVLNSENVGFPAAVNQGVSLARAEAVVILNSDVIVPPGWLAGLMRHLDDPTVGCVGPVTNRIGNEAELEVSYRTYSEMLEFAAGQARDHVGRAFPIRTPAMFCVALSRATWAVIGGLDEGFGIGLLEDDDYAERVRRAGLRLLCAEDVFVHHFGEASFGRLVASGDHARLLRTNKAHFEAKWGKPWAPYDRHQSAEYVILRERVRAAVRGSLPQGSTVAVVSRGDEELLRLDGMNAWHFPQVEDGTYAGYYPSDGDEAVIQLERLRMKGADFLLFPRTAFWWLDHYDVLKRHLEERYELVSRDDACIVFALSESKVAVS